MADGSITIDSRINNKGAYAELKALQAKAKSTAQQISGLDKQIGQLENKHTTLGEDLKQARQEAAAATREYYNLAKALDANNARGVQNDPTDEKRADTLLARMEKQQSKVSELSTEYRAQNAEIASLQQRYAELTGQLEQEQNAANAAAKALARQGDAAASAQRASKAMHHFGVRLKNILLGALVFNLVSSALRTMVNGLGKAITQTDGVNSALARLKGAASTAAAGLASALAPAITWVLNLLTSLLNGFVKLISLLTGKSISGMKQAAKNMNSVGSAAGSAAKQVEKAARSLAGFDEIERLDAPQTDSSSGGGGSSSGVDYGFDQDAGPLDGMIDRVKDFWDAFRAQLEPSVDAWRTAWSQIQQAVADALPVLQQSMATLWENGLKPLGEYFMLDFVPGFLNGISLILAPIAGDVVSSLISVFASAVSSLANILTDAINSWIIPALDLLKDVWLDLATAFNDAWTTYISPIFDWFCEIVQDVCDWVEKLFVEYVDPILSEIVTDLQWLWDEHLQPLFSDLITVGGDAINLIAGILKGAWDSVIAPLANWLLDTFGPVFAQVFKGASEAVSLAFGLIADVLDLALIALKGVIDFLRDVFAGDWGGAWNVVKDTASRIWDSISGKIKGTVNDIIGFVNRMISAIVNGLNSVIRGLNKLNFTVPSWVPGLGGESFGFNISEISAPQIPYLAQGAVIPANREFLAVLGDQTHGTNVEAPLATIQQAVAEVMEDVQAGQMAGFETLAELLRQLISAVYGIELTDEQVGRAAQRWQRHQEIMMGGAF